MSANRIVTDVRTSAGGLPEWLEPGHYQVVMISNWVSDVFVNGQPQGGGEDARCGSDLEVAQDQTEVMIFSIFSHGSCEIEVRNG